MFEGWPGATLGLAASAAIVALGGIVLARRPGHALNRVFFAFTLFSGAAGALTTLANASPGTPGALTATRVFWYVEPWVASTLVILALQMPTPSGWLLRRPVAAHVALLAPAAVVTAAYAVDHGVFYAEASLAGVAYYRLTTIGAAFIGVHGLAVAAALVVLARRFRATPHALQRTQLAWTQAALLVGSVPLLGVLLVYLLAKVPGNASVMGLAVATILAHAAALNALRPWNRSVVTDDDRQVVLVSYLAGTALSVSFALLSFGTTDAVNVFNGVAMVATPAILAYSILKFDLFGLDLKLREIAPRATLGLLLLAAFAISLAGAASIAPAADASRLFLVAGLVTAVTAVPIQRATTRLATRFGWTEAVSQGAAAERRLEVYRAAVENAVTRGEDVDENEFLRELRAKLALSTRDHRLMVQVVTDLQNAKPATPRGPLREGDVVMRKYRVEKFLGSGSFGRALLARHLAMNRLVVIKEPHEAFRSRPALAQLSKEARLAARIQHANVVALHDFEEHEDTGYLVFEYVPGGSLEDLLKGGPLPRERAYDVFRDVLHGLAAIHRAKIVHMDLKPANILLDEEGRAKIGDFGIANEQRVEATLGRSVGPHSHPGTLLYMAPEQVRGRRDPGPAADLYAAGAILHEMLTGARYLDFPESPLLIQEAILFKEPRLDDPRLTPRDQDLLAALLAKAPAERPASAQELLDRYLAGDNSKYKDNSGKSAAAPAREA